MSIAKNTRLLTRADRTRLIVTFLRFYEGEKAKNAKRVFTTKEFGEIAVSMAINVNDATTRNILKELEIPTVLRTPKPQAKELSPKMMQQRTRRRITALETRVQELEDLLKQLRTATSDRIAYINQMVEKWVNK
jgi:hypothetical protein